MSQTSRESQDWVPPPTEQLSADEEHINILPPVIVNNPRRKIEPKMISATKLIPGHAGITHHRVRRSKTNRALLCFVPEMEPIEPVPKYPLAISWTPRTMCFKLDEDTVVQRLAVCNRSSYIIYVSLCGLWDDTGRLGASWKSYPRTRLLLAPGMVGNLFVRAKPREYSPIREATIALQLAASHKRDTVVGYFSVPIHVLFLKHVPPPMMEEEEGEGG